MIRYQATNKQRCFNIAPVANSPLGRKHTDAQRRKLSEAHQGKVMSDEARSNMARAQTGKKHSEATKHKMGELSKKRWEDPNYRRKMRSAQTSPEYRCTRSRLASGENNGMYGKQHSPTAKAKISRANKGRIHTGRNQPDMSGKNNPIYGKKRFVSVETRRKISEANKGKLCGIHHPNSGKKASDETRRKQSEAQKKRWAKRKLSQEGRHGSHLQTKTYSA